MICHIPFLVSAGHIPEPQMRAGSLAIANALRGSLFQYSCNENPFQVLKSLPNENGVVELIGDAAMANSDGCNWLEALGAWRQPTILMAVPLSTGEVPGVAAAYASLCKALSVPLLGIFQLGGTWNQDLRRLDGLPWFGCISDKNSSELTLVEGSNSRCELEPEDIAFRLKQKIITINR